MSSANIMAERASWSGSFYDYWYSCSYLWTLVRVGMPKNV